MNKVVVRVNGILFDNWKSLSINKTIDAICGSFSMTASYKYTEESDPFVLSGRIEVYYKTKVKEHKVLTAFIDSVNTSITNQGLNLEISGRDVTSDLIDCTHKEASQWTQKDYQTIREVIDPFYIMAEVLTDKGDEEKTRTIKPDEKVGSFILKIAKDRGFLAITDEDGSLVLVDKAGVASSKQTLQLGENGNILSASFKADYTKRYSQITVLENADVDNFGDMGLKGASHAEKATAEDEGVLDALEDIVKLVGGSPLVTENKVNGSMTSTSNIGRYRPLTIIESNSKKTSEGKLQKNANWYLALSRASVSTVSLRVQGWLSADELYKINTMVYCDMSRVGVPSADYLIKSLRFEVSEQGTFTSFELIARDAYDDNGFELNDKEKTKQPKFYVDEKEK